MANDDLLSHAKSSVDFYALLGEDIHPGSTEKEISRAYRRAALKSHPDKHKDDPSAVSRFHALQIAYDVLCDPAAKAAYDNARLAREAKRRQDEMFQGKRRAMKEELERRESGAFQRKRKRGDGGVAEEEDAEVVLEREVTRLAEDGRRRRREREEALRKEADILERMDRDGGVAEGEPLDPSASKTGLGSSPSAFTNNGAGSGGSNVPEISRTVKIRWAREGKGQDLDKEKLASLFSIFGPIESTLVMKDKKMRLGEQTKKRVMATGFIVYKSIVGAHAAVEDTKRQNGELWDVLESIEWAEGRAPDFVDSLSAKPSSSGAATTTMINEAPSTPQPTSTKRVPFQNITNTPSTSFEALKAKLASAASGASAAAAISGQPPQNGTTTNNGGLRKVPSFASFSSSRFNSPANSPFKQGGGGGPQSPSLEEITLIRLKNAERRRVEEEIRAREARGLGEEEK